MSRRDTTPSRSTASDATSTNLRRSISPPGKEAFAKILSLRSWLDDDCMAWGGCDTFYVRLMPAEAARTDIARSPFYGSR
jgi:hypothetical protein